MRTVTAFVAHSFAQEDQPKIRPILDHLDTFHELGFLWKSGEAAEADRVSDKIRKRILECEVFIGILTRKNPVFELDNSFASAWKMIRRNLRPVKWTPPGWVVQESGFALGLERKVILFVEPNLDIPQLQGDLEYVPYEYADPTDALRRASQMINRIIATQTGMATKTVLVDVSDEHKKKEAPEPVSPPDDAKQVPPAAPDLLDVFYELKKALEDGNLGVAREHLEAGVSLIRSGKADANELSWRCFCLSTLYTGGDVWALQELERLDADNPEGGIPAEFIGDALIFFKEFSQAAEYYQRAADLSKDRDVRHTRLLACADALINASTPKNAEPILVTLVQDAATTTRTSAVEKLYAVLLSTSRSTEAFGIAEALLHNNPALASFRFALGLDYHTKDQDELFLSHFSLLKDGAPDRADLMHNAALAFAECNLPFASTEHYKRAIELGGTLAASNLGYKYIDAGMDEEASKLLNETLKKENVEPEVARCLAAISERKEVESSRYKDVLEKANKQKKFLVALGEALLQKNRLNTTGLWRLPFGQIQLSVKDAFLSGSAEIAQETAKFGSLYGTLANMGIAPGVSTDTSDIRIYSVSGPMMGLVCKFTLNIRPKQSPQAIGGLLGLENPVQGYLVFDPDGKSAQYAELKDRKLSAFAAVEGIGGWQELKS